MEKEILIKKLLVEEPDYNELALQRITEDTLLDIIGAGNDDLKNRVVSLAVRIPALNPTSLLSFAYENGGVSTKAVVMASLRRVNQEHLFDTRIDRIIADGVNHPEASVLKFALNLIEERRLKKYVPQLKSLSNLDNDYMQNRLMECINSFK
jgi:hypothetical protein